MFLGIFLRISCLQKKGVPLSVGWFFKKILFWWKFEFLLLSVIFFKYITGNLQGDDFKWPKNHFRMAKRWFCGVECKFWGHISIEKCFRDFRLGTGCAIFKLRKIA